MILAAGSALLLTAAVLPAQSTNALPLEQTLKYQLALEQDRALGERALLLPGLKEKMQLTDEQRAELKPFEADFASTSAQYQAANQPRIDAGHEALQQARESKDTGRIQTARRQLQEVWAGLQTYRNAEVIRIKHLLTPDQITVLEDPKNQWRESHADEANDPSAKTTTVKPTQ